MSVFNSLVLKSAALAVTLAWPAACEKKPADPAPVVEETAASGAPALWKTGDADTTIYLFGTVHVLPPTLDWKQPKIETALNEAKAVYFETDINPGLAELSRAIEQLGLYPQGETLSDNLTPEQRAALADASAKLAIPIKQLDSMRPWLAAMTLSEAMILQAGYDPQSGVERKLEPVAQASGKEIRKFETIEEQLLAFADLPQEIQIGYLMDGVAEMDKEQTLLSDLVNAWATGDVAKLEQIMIEGDLADMPEIYQALLVKRNANWVEKIDMLVKTEPGVFFIAVGAGHLAGGDSVQKLLEAKGFTVARLE
jgi:uncharacterized protein YbaP (TraB family)